MAERIKQIPKKLLEIWNNWTKKQKTVIVSAVAVFFGGGCNSCSGFKPAELPGAYNL
ncbi:MAG: hypothetical protein ACLR0W_03380 [Lachnospira sp.]